MPPRRSPAPPQGPYMRGRCRGGDHCSHSILALCQRQSPRWRDLVQTVGGHDTGSLIDPVSTVRASSDPARHSHSLADSNAKASAPPTAPRRQRCCRIPLYDDQGAACGGADVAEFVVLLACPPGRSRLLRAAWRPCSRGPARRAVVADARNGGEPVAHGFVSSSGPAEDLFSGCGYARHAYSGDGADGDWTPGQSAR
jgi:hypothetical protein